jgi:hypothetical protein
VEYSSHFLPLLHKKNEIAFIFLGLFYFYSRLLGSSSWLKSINAGCFSNGASPVARMAAA